MQNGAVLTVESGALNNYLVARPVPLHLTAKHQFDNSDAPSSSSRAPS